MFLGYYSDLVTGLKRFVKANFLYSDRFIDHCRTKRYSTIGSKNDLLYDEKLEFTAL